MLAGGLGWLLGGGRGGVPEDVELELQETTATTWSGRASNLWLALIAVIPIGFALVVEPIWSGVLIVVAVLAIIFAFVEVEVDESRVAVGLGSVGILRHNYAIGKITGAGAIEAQPLAYGGDGGSARDGAPMSSGAALRSGWSGPTGWPWWSRSTVLPKAPP